MKDSWTTEVYNTVVEKLSDCASELEQWGTSRSRKNNEEKDKAGNFPGEF